MSYTTDDPAERERRRWIKPNAYLWVRPDIHRFMRPDAERFFHPTHKGQKPWYEAPEYISPAMRAYAEKPASPCGPDDPNARADAAAAEAERRAFEAELDRLRANNAELQRLLSAQRHALALSRLTRKAGFDPNQPRVPAGHPDGGQWTDADGGSSVGAGRDGFNDRRALSDATPDNEWKPGAQYAQNRSGGGPPRYGRRFPEATPAQQARLAAAEAQANTAIRAVREIDPHWRRTPSIRETIEGQIAAEQAVAREARERLELFHRLGVTRETIRPDAPARPHEDVLAPGGRLIGVRAPRAGDDVRTASAAAFERVRDESMAGARPIRAHESYEGLWFRRADGIRFGLRWSNDHGATIDIIESNSALIDQSFRIHWK